MVLQKDITPEQIKKLYVCVFFFLLADQPNPCHRERRNLG